MKCFSRILMILLVWALFANGAMAMQVYSSLHIPEILRRYASFVQQENGDWVVHDQFAEQRIRQITEDELETYAGKGIILLYPSFRGNEPLGLVEPVLNVFLICEDEMNGDCISIALADEAWHFATTPQVMKYDHFYCEHFVLPLDAEDLGLLASMAELPYSLRIWGADGNITLEVGLEENLKGRQKLEFSWRKTLASFVALCDELELDNYLLWDLNVEYWSEGRPESMRGTSFVQNDLVPMDEIFHVVDSDNVKGVQVLQQILGDAGFYVGKIDGIYGSDTRVAVRDAQKYYGLPETGLADSKLLVLMDNKGKTLEKVYSEAEITLVINENEEQIKSQYIFEGAAEICLERAWIAPCIAVSVHNDSKGITPKNSANYMLAAEGYINNLSTKSLNLAMDFNVSFMLDGVSYPGSLRSKQNHGTTFGVEILPKESVAIICYTEIPNAMVWRASCTNIQIQKSIK